jgi:hypothetical protein
MIARYLVLAIMLLSQISTAEARPSLQDIKEFAKDMCATPPITSTNDQTKLTGDANAKLGSFLSRFANAGVEGSASINREATSGVLQKDLADAIKNSNDCRVAIVGTIINKAGISSKPAQPAHASDSIYQGGIEVGKVFGGRRSPTDAMMFQFVELTHASRLDTRYPFEYDGVILRMVQAQSRVGMDTSRPEDGTVYSGITAQVIGNIQPKE